MKVDIELTIAAKADTNEEKNPFFDRDKLDEFYIKNKEKISNYTSERKGVSMIFSDRDLLKEVSELICS